MKIIKLLSILLLIMLNTSYAQKANPDTLIINTKSGKIILIGDTLQKFSSFNSNQLITNALFKIKDSLSIAEKKAIYKQHHDSLYTRHNISKFPFRLLPVVGLGLVRDKVSPFLGLSLDFAPQRQDYYYKGGWMYTFINVAVVPYFTFERDHLDAYKTYHNVFLEGSFGNRINNAKGYGSVSEFSFGTGYLIRKRGTYFGSNTFKLFTTIGIKNSFVKVRPELLFTDNLKTVFPGIGIKLF
jgi:hypothetical protein